MTTIQIVPTDWKAQTYEQVSFCVNRMKGAISPSNMGMNLGVKFTLGQPWLVQYLFNSKYLLNFSNFLEIFEGLVFILLNILNYNFS